MKHFRVNQRPHPRHSSPKSSSLRTVPAPAGSGRLSAKLSGSFPPTPVPSTIYSHSYTTATPQPLCNQFVAHSFHRNGGGTPLPILELISPPRIHFSFQLLTGTHFATPFFSHSCM